MASRSEKQRQAEENIKKIIVRSHRAGLCDKDGKGWAPRTYGVGHLATALCPFGAQKLNIWPRDGAGRLVGD